MSQRVEPLLAALFTGERPTAVVTTTQPMAPSGQPAAGTSSALQHYRQALDALRHGNWQQFGSEMDGLQKALEATAPPPS